MPSDLDNQQRQTVHFVRLFTECAQRLYSYILVLLPDDDAANDVFQEVSITLWERFDQYKSGTDFWAWAKQIAYYKVLHHRERQKRTTFHVSESLLEELAVEADSLGEMQVQRHRALAECCGKLSPQDREVVERRYAPGATTEQVADDLGRSLHQVYRALRRIHQALFECVSRVLSQEVN